jgi:prophage tail gpP-like protein
MPDRDEIATIVAAGHRFEDWESVRVEIRWADAFPTFTFTAAERAGELPTVDWRTLQLKPGEDAAIYLGGERAISGLILSRQVAYDAENHSVQLSGVGIQWCATRASILDETSDYDGMPFMDIASKVLAPTDVRPKAIGTPNSTPYTSASPQTGENIWAYLERLARVHDIVLGSDDQGNLLVIGDHSFPPTGTLIEGYNILRCQCVISMGNWRSVFIVRGQTGQGGATEEEKYGSKASEMEASVGGGLKCYSPLLTPAEQPVWDESELQLRATADRRWNEGTIIECTITLQGWKRRPGGTLWRAGEVVHVKSPMAMLDQALKIQTLVYAQDVNSGTTTTMDLVAPWLLKDQYSYNVGSTPGPTDKATSGAGKPATTPPDGTPHTPPPLLLPDQ